MIIFKSLDIDYIHGDIHGRSCKKSVHFERVQWCVDTYWKLMFSEICDDHFIHYGLVTPFGIMDLSQCCFR